MLIVGDNSGKSTLSSPEIHELTQIIAAYVSTALQRLRKHEELQESEREISRGKQTPGRSFGRAGEDPRNRLSNKNG